MAALLGQVGGRQVDGDAARRQSQPRRDQRRAHPLARLRYGFVGQPHDVERHQAGRDLDLYVDGPDLDALECHRGDALNHPTAPADPCILAQLFELDKNNS